MGSYGPASLPAQTAGGATSTTEIGTVQVEDANGMGINAIEITPPAGYSTVTGVATNNVTFNVRQLRAGSPLGTVGSLTLNAGVNLVAETAVAVPVTGAFATQANDVLDVQMVQNGTGLAVGAGLLVEVAVN